MLSKQNINQKIKLLEIIRDSNFRPDSVQVFNLQIFLLNLCNSINNYIRENVYKIPITLGLFMSIITLNYFLENVHLFYISIIILGTSMMQIFVTIFLCVIKKIIITSIDQYEKENN